MRRSAGMLCVRIPSNETGVAVGCRGGLGQWHQVVFFPVCVNVVSSYSETSFFCCGGSRVSVANKGNNM